MKQGRLAAGVAAALLCAGCSQLGGGRVMITGLSSDFDGDAVGTVPAIYRAEETNPAGKPGRWGVVAGGAGGSGGCMQLSAVHNEGETFNLLTTTGTCVADLRLSVKLRADAGVEDQGGGVFWRGLGPADYYVARFNPLEDNLRVYKVQDGVRSQFQSAKVIVEPGKWHDLVVTMEGDHMTVGFDGQTLLDHHDVTFPGAGFVGLWTKADAATSFDDFVVESLHAPK